MVLEKRFIQIVLKLNNSKNYIPLIELSNALGVSTKTLSRDIKNNDDNDLLNTFGFQILTKQGTGHKIKISDKEKFQFFLDRCLNDSKNIYNMPRENAIISLLLQQDDFIIIAKIADYFYVSDATISMHLKSIKHTLKRYDLQIVKKPSKGIRLLGDEMNMRFCMSKYLVLAENPLQKSNFINNQIEDIRNIGKIVVNILRKYNIYMSELSREHLERHILVSVYRIKMNHGIFFDKIEKKNISNKEEYKIAKEIFGEIKKKYSINVSNDEIMYIAIQLLGKRTLNNVNEQHLISQDIEVILKLIFKEIHIQMGIDLTSDQEVFNYLVMHFEPMFVRLKYGIKSNNPLLDEVKIRQTTSFEMGLIAKEVIGESYKYHLDDIEVSFLAMYFSLALDHVQSIRKPKKILVVCGLGVCSSRILIYKLRQQYGKYIDKIETVQYHNISKHSQKYYDCIISTVDKKINTKLPLIYITDFLNEITDKKLSNIFFEDILPNSFILHSYLCKDYFMIADTMRDEEEAIDFIINHLSQYINIPEELKINIMEREVLSSTAHGNYCAFPHPIRTCTDKNFFAVLCLNKAMNWGNKKVKFIFLLSPSRDNPSDLQKITDILANFVLEPHLFNKFIKNPKYEVLYDIFTTFE
ncbi:MAG: BglG family transcription antiterminator [Breznakia sp.]